MSNYRKGYIQGVKDLFLYLTFFGGYTYIIVKAIEIILK